MDSFDTEKAARVWQRVQNRPVCVTDLEAQAQSLTALYRALVRENGNADLRALLRGAEECAQCLRGLKILSAESIPPDPPIKRRDAASSLLRHCCHSENALYHALLRASSDADWGSVYAHLAAASAERLNALLRAIGRRSCRLS